MGLYAVYRMVDDGTLGELRELDSAALTDALEALDEESADELDLEKMWDALHFWLTGQSALSPVEGNPLSQAVMGLELLGDIDSEEDEFFACVSRDALEDIVTALEEACRNAQRERFRPQSFADAGIYPAVRDDEPEQLWQELSWALRDLTLFYTRAAETGCNVVISIT